MQIVKFKDGGYGLRKWSWVFFKYIYFFFPRCKDTNGWWSTIPEHAENYRTTEARARRQLELFTDKGEVVMGSSFQLSGTADTVGVAVD